ncbi:uncharacterized protein LOC110839678 isoform X1 [Zootermopsis nevadensis]|uniref:uncharacterized protein LOC110839678 isoform X1 n=2 Tax=Zootermopsis nevadensis TaxID=136037 RepID=UPI000B8E8A76|nr:uncharacterized protein LOC110839678 isoform X1 [Zootermopsis nevadensis]
MPLITNPNSLASLSLDALGKCVAVVMRRMIETCTHEGAFMQNLDYQAACGRLEELLRWLPTDQVEDFTYVLIGHVNKEYATLVADGNFRDACEEIAPLVLKSLMHPNVKKLDCIRFSHHPKISGFYKIRVCDLIYKTLPMLQGLTELGIGVANRTPRMRLEVRSFADTLQKFSSRSCEDRDVQVLADCCRKLKCLDISLSTALSDGVVEQILRFTHLEELNLFEARFISPGALRTLFDNLLDRNVVVPPIRRQRSLRPPRAEFLRVFGCSAPTVDDIISISYFTNVVSLSLSSVHNISLSPLSNLMNLTELALCMVRFEDVRDLLRRVGSRLTCLNLTEVTSMNLTYLRQWCPVVNCLHICNTDTSHLILPENWNARFNHQESDLTFPSVTTLELSIESFEVEAYVLCCVPNVTKLYLHKDLTGVTFQLFIRRVFTPRLRTLFWGSEGEITFSEDIATSKVFYDDGNTEISHIVLSNLAPGVAIEL